MQFPGCRQEMCAGKVRIETAPELSVAQILYLVATNRPTMASMNRRVT